MAPVARCSSSLPNWVVHHNATQPSLARSGSNERAKKGVTYQKHVKLGIGLVLDILAPQCGSIYQLSTCGMRSQWM